MPSFDFNEEFAHAYDVLENYTDHLFITGKAGTGKSTLLNYFREHTSKNIVVLAPTGVAAVNVKGQTVHSFFKFKPDVTLDAVSQIRLRKSQRKIYEQLDAILIDEISMLRADIMDCIDLFLQIYGPKKEKAFGGIQMIFFG
ncbi:MAG: AAA family ATPase, partial [Candidatus Omnitrophica bacterium]|nr:AAA family ATPase [Candidatus Omnitrophota bacterium]